MGHLRALGHSRRRARLVVMVKNPLPGRVKTRLGRDIGMVPAAWWMRHQQRDLLRRLRDPRWELVLAVSPDTSVQGRAWPSDLTRIAQGNGDLGDRMGRILRGRGVWRWSGPTCIIGSDIPAISRPHIARAFAALGRQDGVIGPALDGGYWLIGFNGVSPPPPGLFHDVRWSSRYTLDDTIASMPGRRIAMVDRLADVDRARDLG